MEDLKPKAGKTINPDIKRRVLEVFNEVWYDYDEEWGRVEMPKYKEIMRFVKIQEKFPDFSRPEDDPFSDLNLEKAFEREQTIKYVDQERVKDKIHHRSVMYICHDIYSDILRKSRITKTLMKLREQNGGSPETATKPAKLSAIDARLKAINDKI